MMANSIYFETSNLNGTVVFLFLIRECMCTENVYNLFKPSVKFVFGNHYCPVKI